MGGDAVVLVGDEVKSPVEVLAGFDIVDFAVLPLVDDSADRHGRVVMGGDWY